MDLNCVCMFLTSDLISMMYTGQDKNFSPLVNISVLPHPGSLNTALFSENLNLVFLDPEFIRSLS